MMMKKYNLYIILFICTLSSCSDFLEESSQDLMIPRSVKDYKELFFGEVMKTNEKDIPHPYLEYMTDDVKDQCYYGTRPQVISNDFREYVWAYYTWQGNPEVGISNELTPDVAWTVYYHKILMTNIILDQLYTMNGTDMERQDLAGEAYFMRAFSYFMLANLYGKPYHPATANEDLCVPLNKEIGLSDKILASRIALFQEKYDVTILYCDSVFKVATQPLYKLQEKKDHYFFSLANKEILLSYGLTSLETHMKEDFRYTGNLVVSDDLLALYSEDDLRLTNYFKNTIGNQTRPTNKQYSVYTPIKWTKNSATVYANALRISEAYLNRAEAFAELGNTNKALADLNELRENRMKPGTPPLAVDEDGIVATVRKERRRELAFEGFRWFDLRRYGCPPLTHTYSSKENEGAGDVFELKEKGYVLPIPKSERERNTEIEIFDRPNSEPVNN